MKNSIVFKALAILLATVFLLTAVGSAVGIIVLIGMDLYGSTLEEVYDRQTYWDRREFAVNLVHRYVSLELGELPEEYLNQYYGNAWLYNTYPEDSFAYSIYDDNGDLVHASAEEMPENDTCYEIEIDSVNYRRCITAEEEAKNPAQVVYNDSWYDSQTDEFVEFRYVKDQVSGYIVRLFLADEARTYDSLWLLLQDLYGIRFHLFWVLGASLLVFLAFAIYLCCAAGRKPGTEEVRAGGLNRLPLDLYSAAAITAVGLLIALAVYLISELVYNMTTLLLYFLLLIGSTGCLILVALLVAWAAQLKMPEYYWAKNTVIGRILRLIGRFFRWVGQGINWCFRALHALFRLLPVMGQWLLVCTVMPVMLALLGVFCLGMWNYYMDWIPPLEILFLLLFLVCLGAFIALPVYCAYCLGILMKGVRRMSQGDLGAKIPTKYLLGGFRDFALQLNTLSDAISIAAEKQTRSERMKTELITNVSHDIKTPLTSIINFVDLLQKPHTPEQEQEYLEVLSRQSGQMKKLIEDLMELSKASSGNLTVNLQKMDAVEAINQALGEFSDKLEAAGLTPVFRQPENPIYITADGRHVWRVLFNLLTNAVKYALPGTRLYIDLMRVEDKVVLSVKNVSRAELNISADELMERFVQGDASRKAEGSGLGLNIAKSLMEVQHGGLQLLLDGDLFKVTLTFPAAE